MGKVRFYLVGVNLRRMSTCAEGVLTAARFVVEAGGHEEALLGGGGRQGPLVGRKDGDHQWRELALDLLMREAEEGGGVWVGCGGGGGEERKEERFLKRPRQTSASATPAGAAFFSTGKVTVLFFSSSPSPMLETTRADTTLCTPTGGEPSDFTRFPGF